MKKRLVIVLLALLFVVSSAGVGPLSILGVGKGEVVEAAPSTWKKGNYYWDSRNGRYVVNSYPIYKGSTVNSPGVNDLLKKANTAVKNKYGKIDKNKNYKFSVVQWVSQANITSMRGSVRSVVCNGTY